MTIPVRRFDSTFPGSPSLPGQVGATIALLDACLINGWGSVSVTSITRVGSTATATVASHYFVENCVSLIAGVNESGYNGEQRLFNVSPTQFSWTVSGSETTPATGTITAKVAPQGQWAKVYSGTNLAVYRSTDTNGPTRHYYRIDDTNAQYTNVAGYESMSDVNTGVNRFPTAAQIANSINWRKSSTADSVARPWILGCDGRSIEFYSAWLAGTTTIYARQGLGELITLKPNDVFHSYVFGSSNTIMTNAEQGNSAAICNKLACTPGDHAGTVFPAIYLARNYTQIGSSITAGFYLDGSYVYQNSTNLLSAGVFGRNNSYTGYGETFIDGYDPITGGVIIRRIPVGNRLLIRGYSPGVWAPMHNLLFTMGDTVVPSSGENTGRTLIPINIAAYDQVLNAANSYGQILLDTTGPWR